MRNRKTWTCALALFAALAITGCGGDDDKDGDSSKVGEFPDMGALASKLVPSINSSSTALSMGNVSYLYNDNTAYGSSQGEFLDVFGPAGGVNTRIRVQLDIASGEISGINSNHIDADGNFKDCTAITTDSGLTVPYFSTTGTATFWAGDYDDTGKYECFTTGERGDNTYATAFGKEEITEPAEGCTDANRYYVAMGYSVGTSTDGGYQMQKFVYDGCTKDIAIGMAIGGTPDTTITDGTSQGFKGRFELTGNTEENTFTVRTFKHDQYSGTEGYHLIEAKGTSIATSGNAYFRMMLTKNCNQTGCGSATTEEYCVLVGETEGDYSVVTDSTLTAANCDTITGLPASFTNLASELTPIVMGAAAYGLE